MKILILSGTFFPKQSPRSFRTTELTEELLQLGHEVTLYIPKIEYNYSKYTEKYPINIRHYEELQEKRKFLGISLIDRIIFHYLNWLLAYPSLQSKKRLRKAICNETGYDLLITIAMPHYIHWAVGELYERGKRLAKTWIADCGDPFMLADSGAKKPPFYFKRIEKIWCGLCDYIAVPTETSYLGYYPEFKNKIRVIPQGFDFDKVELAEYRKNDVPTFAFTGIFIKGKRDPRRLLEWLSSLDIPFRFIAYGNNVRQFMEPYKQKLGDKIVIENPIPRKQLLMVISKMDFLLNIGNGTSVQTPSKLIDYTLAKRPILTIESNDIKEEILMEFLKGDYTHQDTPIDISKYNIHNVAKQFIDLTC